MGWIAWTSRWLPVVGLVATLLGSIDPLEGFPIVLLGGVLILMAAVQDHSRHTRLVLGGLVAAALGCAAMVGLSASGGVGGSTGRSLGWLVVLAPYPVGVIVFVFGAMLVLRARSAGSDV